ncbi:MAG: hypothetical protein ABEH59_12295 [Halobacteriales archaeon]
MPSSRGDVVRSTDPFKYGLERQRPWLVVNNDRHTFAAEQYVAVAITNKSYATSIPLENPVWEISGVPADSDVSPWAVHSPRAEDFDHWQGRVLSSFVEDVIDRLEALLR